MERFNLFLPSRHISGLVSLREQTGLSASELIRRFLDYGFQDKVLNEIVPSCSGHVSVEVKKL